MSLSITTSRNDLLSEARAEFNRTAVEKAVITGQKAAALPPDTVLIATDPTLSSEIQAADATPVTSAAAVPMAGGSVAASSSAQNGKVLSLVG